MDVGSAFPANAQAAVLVQSGVVVFHDPADGTQAGVVVAVPLRAKAGMLPRRRNVVRRFRAGTRLALTLRRR